MSGKGRLTPGEIRVLGQLRCKDCRAEIDPERSVVYSKVWARCFDCCAAYQATKVAAAKETSWIAPLPLAGVSRHGVIWILWLDLGVALGLKLDGGVVLAHVRSARAGVPPWIYEQQPEPDRKTTKLDPARVLVEAGIASPTGYADQGAIFFWLDSGRTLTVAKRRWWTTA